MHRRINITLLIALFVFLATVPVYAAVIPQTITYSSNTASSLYDPQPPLSPGQSDVLLGAAAVLFAAGVLLALQPRVFLSTTVAHRLPA